MELKQKMSFVQQYNCQMLKKVNYNISSQPKENDLSDIDQASNILPTIDHEHNILQILAICDQLQLPKNIKYTARHILDLSLFNCFHLMIHHQDHIPFACIALALELDKDLQGHINQKASHCIQQIISHDDAEYLINSIKAAIPGICSASNSEGSLGLLRNQKTPFDCVGDLKAERFPKINIEAFRAGVENMIELALTGPYLPANTPQEVFNASIDAFLSLKGEPWKPSLNELLPAALSESCVQLRTYLLKTMQELQS